MNALIFAAGRGERMRPLSDTTAKPLLMAGGRRLIEWQIAALVRAGVTRIVINTAHLAAQIEDTLGDGGRYGARAPRMPWRRSAGWSTPAPCWVRHR